MVRKQNHHIKHEDIEPFKDTSKLRYFENELLHGTHQYGTPAMEIWFAWQVGKCCLLRISDVLKLKYKQVYDEHDEPRKTVVTYDKKTNKYNPLNLIPLRQILVDYRDWRDKRHINSPWLIPSVTNQMKPVRRQVIYRRLTTVAEDLGFHHISCHSCRKTGAYILYLTTNNLAMVSHILNHSSILITERYLGISDPAITSALNSTDFETVPKH